jgi:glycosyltransferase involved in cell wall biosynthesis
MGSDRTGIENYLHHLLPSLAVEWGGRTAIFAPPGWTPPALPGSAELLPGGGRGWTQVLLPRALRELKPAAYFSPIPILPVVLPMPCPAVVTVHDFHEFRARWRYFRRLLAVTFRRSAGIICVSDASQSELVSEFPWAASKTTVVREAADEVLYRPRPDPTRPTGAAAVLLERLGVAGLPLLAVGTIQPRKNYDTLLRAYALALEHPVEPGAVARAVPDLVIAGRPGWEYEEVLGLPARLGIADRVHFAGHLPEEELAELMRSAVMLCALSTAEGFGLPLVEAMFSGVPILASDIPPFREVAGTAARFVDPHDAGAIAGALVELLDSPSRRAEMGQTGLRRRSLFSWSRAASEVAAVLERAAGT